jgi:hypothetical protein
MDKLAPVSIGVTLPSPDNLVTVVFAELDKVTSAFALLARKSFSKFKGNSAVATSQIARLNALNTVLAGSVKRAVTKYGDCLDICLQIGLVVSMQASAVAFVTTRYAKAIGKMHANKKVHVKGKTDKAKQVIEDFVSEIRTLAKAINDKDNPSEKDEDKKKKDNENKYGQRTITKRPADSTNVDFFLCGLRDGFTNLAELVNAVIDDEFIETKVSVDPTNHK